MVLSRGLLLLYLCSFTDVILTLEGEVHSASSVEQTRGRTFRYKEGFNLIFLLFSITK